MLLAVVMQADKINKIICVKEILPFLSLFTILIPATHKTIIIEPIICNKVEVSLKIIMPNIKDITEDITFTIDTKERSASFKTLRINDQLKANNKPFKAKIKTNSIGITIPKGTQIKEQIKATVVNKTKTIYSLDFLIDCFLKTL